MDSVLGERGSGVDKELKPLPCSSLTSPDPAAVGVQSAMISCIRSSLLHRAGSHRLTPHIRRCAPPLQPHRVEEEAHYRHAWTPWTGTWSRGGARRHAKILTMEERHGGMGCRPIACVGNRDRLVVMLLTQICYCGPFLVSANEQIDEDRGRVSPVWLFSMPVRARLRDVERE